MEQLFAKPLKRFFFSSKQYANKHTSEKFGSVRYIANSDQENINMTEIKSILRMPDKHRESNVSLKNERNKSVTDNSKKRTPVIRVTVKVGTQFCDKIDTEHKRDYCNEEQLSNIDRQNAEISENNSENNFVLEENNNKSYEKWPVQLEKEKNSIENGCIFDENKSRPLSPILLDSTAASLHFRAVEELIDFHERQMDRGDGKSFVSKPPLMGTSALLSRSQESKRALDDSEIISALVRDRFVVNMFESRSYRRSMRKKPSNYGRIYKSLERTVCTDCPSNGEIKQKRTFDSTFENIICVKQSSPIQLKDQPVSINTKKNFPPLCSLSEDYPASGCVSSGDLEITKNNQNSCQKSERKMNALEMSGTCEFPEVNLCNSAEDGNSETEELSEEIIGAVNKSNSAIDVNKEKDSSSNEEERTETTAEMCSSDSQEAEINLTSSNAETEDMCSVFSESKCSTSTSSLPSIIQTAVIPSLTATEVKQESMDSIEKLLQNSVSTDLSYNMEEFLEKALGEELCNYTNLDTTADVTAKTQNSKPQAVLQEDSICTSDASDLISKINSIQSNFYRSLTKKLQHMSDTLKYSGNQKQEDVIADDDLSSIFPNNEEVTALVQQAAVQYEAMKQITKALTVCRNMKEFCISSEQIEGERLLLIATYKRQAILDEIRRLDYELDENTGSMETGTLMISGVTLPMKDDTVEQPPARREHKHWYVCIFSYGPRVVATQPTLATPDGYVKFSEEVIFTELPSDFSINMEVYCLPQRRSGRIFSHESKYHINKSMKASHCPTPKKFLQREKTTLKNLATFETGIRTSSFKLCGCLKLRVADLAKPGPWFMRKIPLCSLVNGSVSMNLQRFVQIPLRHAGFLTIGTESGGCTAWNRRWCVVDGPLLRFWNYPNEEDSCDPLREINLKNCVNATIQMVDRALCARPRTLLLEIAQNPECRGKDCIIEQHFLSTDTSSDLKIWESKLNTIVTALRTWNVAYY